MRMRALWSALVPGALALVLGVGATPTEAAGPEQAPRRLVVFEGFYTPG
jgi:hypothetical protein